MTDIRFYDFDFNPLKDCSNPVSVYIERYYCGYGCAEIHFGINEQEIISLLEENKYLFFVSGENTVIVTGWQFGEDIAIFGRTAEWLLTRRGVGPVSFADTNAEIIARSIVAKVTDFVVLGEPSNAGSAMDYSADKAQSLYDAVRQVLKTQGLGFEILPDVSAKAFMFRVYEGGESQAMFSPSNRTAYDVEYSVEKQNMATNSGWYERRYKDMGSWNAETNQPNLNNNNMDNAFTFYKITSSQTANRFDLSCCSGAYLYCDNAQGVWKVSEARPDTIWLYIDDSSESGIKKWDAVLNGTKTEEEAKREISQMTARRDTRCEGHRLEYGKDYYLGDRVRAQLEFGDFKVTRRKRVDSVVIYNDIDKSGVIPGLEDLEE